jgi:hypothetical protein
MKLLIKNSANTVYFTLAEKATLASPYYLFKVESLDTNESILFTGTDLSDNTDRFNKFTITETSGATNYTASTVSLNVGEWNYYVYEMSASTNLAISGTTGLIVESGIIYVSGTTTPSTYTFTSSDDDETVVEFNNI